MAPRAGRRWAAGAGGGAGSGADGAAESSAQGAVWAEAEAEAEAEADADSGGGGVRGAAERALELMQALPPPPPSSRTKWTRRVPHPVLIGHAASLTPYKSDTPRPSPRTLMQALGGRAELAGGVLGALGAALAGIEPLFPP